MKKLYLLLPILGLIYFPLFTNAQCADGEVEVELLVFTDNYGYEGYWQLVPNGNNCDDGTIAEGGNSAVGCNGAGDQNQTPGGYANNQTYTEGPWCLNEGESYDLIYVDDWGDGAFNFQVLVDGYIVSEFEGMGLGATFTFEASLPPSYDMAVTAINLDQYVELGETMLDISVFNAGLETVSSFDLSYSVNGGEAVTSTINFIQLDNFEGQHIFHPQNWFVNDFGVYTLEVWVSNINGNADENNANDALTIQVEAGPGRPNIIDTYIDGTVSVEEIANSGDDVNRPTDLDFHPVLNNKELWVMNKDQSNTGGSTVTIFNAGEPDQSELWKRDGNAWHFMSLPTGIAFSQNGNFANSPGVFDANHNGGDPFTGPALWSSNMDVYAEPSGGNGSHLDMLHESPQCQGVAAETGNAFWLFDGYNSDIVRYDFVEDHGPGNDDHSDGIIRRYSDDAVAMDPNEVVVSHLELDGNKQWLYVVDYGNSRVFRIDITTGEESPTSPSFGPFEPLAEYSTYTNYTQEDVITEGLVSPAGVAVMEDFLIVSEHSTGEIIIYDILTLPATEVKRIQTGFSSLQGITIGPEGRIWGVDFFTNTVFVLNSDIVSVSEEDLTRVKLWPNPAVDEVQISSESRVQSVRIIDSNGRVCKQQGYGGLSRVNLDITDLDSGSYLVQVYTNKGTRIEKLIIR